MFDFKIVTRLHPKTAVRDSIAMARDAITELGGEISRYELSESNDEVTFDVAIRRDSDAFLQKIETQPELDIVFVTPTTGTEDWEEGTRSGDPIDTLDEPVNPWRIQAKYLEDQIAALKDMLAQYEEAVTVVYKGGIIVEQLFAGQPNPWVVRRDKLHLHSAPLLWAPIDFSKLCRFPTLKEATQAASQASNVGKDKEPPNGHPRHPRRNREDASRSHEETRPVVESASEGGFERDTEAPLQKPLAPVVPDS